LDKKNRGVLGKKESFNENRGRISNIRKGEGDIRLGEAQSGERDLLVRFPRGNSKGRVENDFADGEKVV